MTQQELSEKVKLRLGVLWGSLILMLIYMVVVVEMGLGDSRLMTPLAKSVSNKIFFGGLIYVIIQIMRNKKLLNNRNLLLAQSNNKRDERQQFLYDKSGGIVVDILMLLLLFATCTTALMNMVAFNLSFGILGVTTMLKVGSYVIYSRIY